MRMYDRTMRAVPYKATPNQIHVSHPPSASPKIDTGGRAAFLASNGRQHYKFKSSKNQSLIDSSVAFVPTID